MNLQSIFTQPAIWPGLRREYFSQPGVVSIPALSLPQVGGVSEWVLLSLTTFFQDEVPPHGLATYRAHTSPIPAAPSTPVQPEVTT